MMRNVRRVQDRESTGDSLGEVECEIQSTLDDAVERDITTPLYIDVGHWPITVSDNLRIDLIKRGSITI
jgi:hypothetical protein